MRRRALLQGAGAFALGLGSGCSSSPPASTSGSQKASPNPPLSSLGLQLYTVRTLMVDDVAGTLQLVRSIGYQEVEFAGYFGVPASDMATLLADLGLSAPAGHFDLELFEGDMGPTLEQAATLGHQYVILAWIPDERRTAEGFSTIAARLNEVGARAQAMGIKVAYHNHDYEFETLPDQDERAIDLLLRELDPNLVRFELDTYWAARAGVDPSLLLVQNPGRFELLHLKDISERLAFADVGSGTLDWPTLIDDARASGVLHYFVEHDAPADPKASIEASYRYLTATG